MCVKDGRFPQFSPTRLSAPPNKIGSPTPRFAAFTKVNAGFLVNVPDPHFDRPRSAPSF